MKLCAYKIKFAFAILNKGLASYHFERLTPYLIQAFTVLLYCFAFKPNTIFYCFIPLLMLESSLYFHEWH